MVPKFKFQNYPADVSLKENLSIDAALEPLFSYRETLPLTPKL